MAKIKAKGHEFEAFHVRDSFNRRVIQFRNNIIQTLRKIGLTEDDVDIPLGLSAIKKPLHPHRGTSGGITSTTATGLLTNLLRTFMPFQK